MRRPRDVERPFQIDVDDRAKAVGRQLVGEADEVASGAVDQNVEAAERVNGARDHAVHVGWNANVTGHGDRTHAMLPDLPGSRLEVLDLPAGDRHVAPRVSQRERNAPADPGPAAGHERGPPFQEI